MPGGVSNVDIDGNNALQIKAIGVVISTFETLPVMSVSMHVYCLPIAHESASHSRGYKHVPRIVRSKDVPASVVLRQGIQQRLGLLEVGSVKALGEPSIDRCQEVMGF